MESDVKKRKSSGAIKRLRAGILLCIFFCLALFIYLSINLRPAMAAQAEARIRAVTVRAMNEAILDVMESGEAYSKLIEIREDGKHVYLLQADARRMNLLATSCADAAQERISLLGKQGTAIPLGTITGLSILSGRGPLIRVGFTPVGSVQSSFRSEFIDAGINQTLYRVNLSMNASVKLILPGLTENLSILTEAAVCESILVGEVPQVYTNVEDTEDMLNLIPTELP